MICSGRQTVVLKILTSDDLDTLDKISERITLREPAVFDISDLKFEIADRIDEAPVAFVRTDTGFSYRESLGQKDHIYIIGGGHCALALSEMMARLDFRVSIFDDRPELNTLEKNEFADSITTVESYEEIAGHVSQGENAYVVVMTLGYRTDEIVIRRLLGRRFKYFGVLGSKAKMATLLRELKNEGFPQDQLAAIRTPIGIPINSHTPEEIAVSIAAEIISVKNA
jgi:xanthine dehydrogenase accessory factor